MATVTDSRTDRILIRERKENDEWKSECRCEARETSEQMRNSSEQITELLRKRERVCTFIDNSNLFHTIKSMTTEIGSDRRLDYIQLRDALASGRRVDVRFYYSTPQGENDSTASKESQSEWDVATKRRNGFYDFLSRRLGYFMIELPLRERPGYNPVIAALVRTLREKGVSDSQILQITKQRPHWLRQIEGESVSEEKGLDCEIVYDMVKLSQSGHYDTFVLVAGDEDYARTIRKLRNETGIRIEVAFFANTCSSVLKREASDFIDLSSIPELFQKVY